MSPVIRQQYRELQTLANRIRTGIKATLWGLVLWLPLGVALAFTYNPALEGGLGHFLAFTPFLVALFATLYLAARTTTLKSDFFCDDDDPLSAGSYTNAFRKWVCGFCDTAHKPFTWYFWPQTLLQACPKCKEMQHSVLCKECDRPIVWDDERFARNPKKSAWLYDYPPASVPAQKTTPTTPPRPIDEDLR
jgi:hypothetical protein